MKNKSFNGIVIGEDERHNIDKILKYNKDGLMKFERSLNR